MSKLSSFSGETLQQSLEVDNLLSTFPAARFASAENVTDQGVAESYERFTLLLEYYGEIVVLPDSELTTEVVSDSYVCWR